VARNKADVIISFRAGVIGRGRTWAWACASRASFELVKLAIQAWQAIYPGRYAGPRYAGLRQPCRTLVTLAGYWFALTCCVAWAWPLLPSHWGLRAGRHLPWSKTGQCGMEYCARACTTASDTCGNQSFCVLRQRQ